MWTRGLGEACGPHSPNSPCSPTGILRVWEAASGQCVYTQPQMPGLAQELTHCTLARTAGLLLTVTADHNLLIYEAHSLQLQKQVGTCPCPVQDLGFWLPFIQVLTHGLPAPTPPQFAGYSEEVLDVRFLGPNDSHIVVASNSPCLKVFELQTLACQILHGHTGKPSDIPGTLA